MSQSMEEPRGHEPVTPQAQPNLQPLKFIWLALIFSVFIYALLPVVLRLPKIDVDPQFKAILFIALSVVSVATIIAIFVVHKIGLSRTRVSGTSALDTQVERYRKSVIHLISWMLAETIAIYGIVLYLVFHEPMHLYPFIAVAFGLLILLAPREDRSSVGSAHSDLARPDVKIG
jgi:hypothetical protein